MMQIVPNEMIHICGETAKNGTNRVKKSRPKNNGTLN